MEAALAIQRLWLALQRTKTRRLGRVDSTVATRRDRVLAHAQGCKHAYRSADMDMTSTKCACR